MDGGAIAEEEIRCEVCKSGFTSGMKAVRIRYGSARYRKRGTVFTHYPDDPDRWLHEECLNNSGADVEFMEVDQCVLCGQQFFEVETALELVSGQVYVRPGDPVFNFREEFMGHIHWACAVDTTDIPIDIDEPDDE